MDEQSFLKLLQDEGTQVIELCAGRIKDGREFHAFIKMDIENGQRYRADLAKGVPLDLNSYGEILHTGWGKEPDAATCALITEKHTDNLKLLETIGRDAAAMNDILIKNSKGTA